MEVRIIKDEEHEMSFELAGADQSFPQLLVEKLNADKSVEFAAAKLEHPVIANPVLTVRTKKGSARDAVISALRQVAEEVEGFRHRFLEAAG